MSQSQIGIVGATGLVGQAIIDWLLWEGYAADSLKLFASERSAGKVFEHAGNTWPLFALSEESVSSLNTVFLAASRNISLEWAPFLSQRGICVIDNSSAFRLAEGVPLVIPEINGSILSSEDKLIANPNCTTAITLMAMAPLHRTFGLKHFIASTYQAVSGSGRGGLQALESELSGDTRSNHSPFSQPIAHNVLPHIGSFLENGYTEEEMKLSLESQKILNHPSLRGSSTCVRVPTLRSHAVSIQAQFENPVSTKMALEVLERAPGIEVFDNADRLEYPTPQLYAENAVCAVGRIREDLVFENGLSLWVVGDQLWRGAAMNAVKILQSLRKEQPVSTNF